MIHWICSQCDESLEAPDGFEDVLQCPKCGKHSRPPTRITSERSDPKPMEYDPSDKERKFQANVKAKKSHAEKRYDHYTEGSVWVFRLGWILIVGAGIMILVGFTMDTTSGQVHNLGLLHNRMVTMIVGSAILVSGFVCIALGAIGTGLIRLMLDYSDKST